MKSFLRIVFVVVIFMPGLVEASAQSMLKDLGLKVGEPYLSAKTKLLKNGWSVDVARVESMNTASPYEFKEVICGNGKDASCSVRFIRKDQEIMLTMRPKKSLIIDGAWNDK